MKYLKPVELYRELIKKNVMKKNTYQCHRLLGLELSNTHLNLAVSNPENKIAVPLCSVDRQENDMGLMVDKFQTLISEHNVIGFIVRFPYKINFENPDGTSVKNFIDDLCKTRKLEGLNYTYWDDILALKKMDFVLTHHVSFICKHLNHLSEDVSKEVMDKFIPSRVLQGYLDCASMILENDNEEDNLVDSGFPQVS